MGFLETKRSFVSVFLFFCHSENLCLLTDVFRPLLFKVMTDTIELTFTMFITVFICC